MRAEADTGRSRRGEIGASVIEYTMLVGLIAIMAISALMFVGQAPPESLSTAGQSLSAN